MLAGATRPLFWGLLVGGADLAVLPAGPTWAVVVTAALVLRASSSPKDRRLSDLPDRSKFLRLGVVTALFVAAPALGIRPSAFLLGAVLFLASKTLRARPANTAAVAGALGTLMLSGYLQHPQLLPTGDAWSVGGVARDLLRFLMLLVLLFGARDDERRVAEVEQARESAVRDERLRISRELHDVVAHHVSVMTIQTEGGRSLLPPGADRADAVLARAAEAGRTALGELRRLLGVLRSTDAGDLGPQPSLADLDRLLDDARAAGVTVELEVEGDPAVVPDGVGLSAYRIVQEAVTNALKHAAGASISVRLRYGPASVDVDVVNGSGRHPTADGGPGHGLVGMRERASLLDGTLEAGPADVEGGRGWRVQATLPFDAVRS